jgi:hypothetical protein
MRILHCLPKSWETKEKQCARAATIINAYRHFFKTTDIPADRQYWTMCGQNVGEDGRAWENGEYYQVSKSGLISPKQFFGVEIDPTIHTLNTSITNGPNWLEGDFLSRMLEWDDRAQFNPAIVNIDHIRFPEAAGHYAASVLSFLTRRNIRQVMVVLNVILSCYSRKASHIEILQSVLEDRLFNPYIDQWYQHDEVYVYAGSNEESTNTLMGEILLFRF